MKIFFLVATFTSFCFATPFEDALSQMMSGEFQKSATTLESLTRSEPQNALYWFNYGTALFNLKEYRKAISAFDKVVSLQSKLLPASLLCQAKAYRLLLEFSRADEMLDVLEKKDSGLDQAIESERQNISKARLDFALTSFQKNDIENAEKALRGIRKTGSGADEALLKGLVALKSGDRERAMEQFKIAESGDGDTKHNAIFFRESLAKQKRISFWAFADAGAGYNTNVYLDGNSESPTQSPATQVIAGAGVKWLEKFPWNARANYVLYWDETPGALTGRFLSQSLRLPIAHEKNSNSFSVSPVLQYQTLETDPYLLKAGVSVVARRKTSFGGYSGTYDFMRQWPQTPGNSYLLGDVHTFGAWVEYFAGNLDAELGYAFYLEQVGDLEAVDSTLPLAATSHGPSMRVVWIFHPHWELELSGSYLFRDFTNVAQPGSLKRFDQKFRAYGKLSYEWFSGFRTFFSANALINTSTLGAGSNVNDSNYTQLLGLMGVSWQVL